MLHRISMFTTVILFMSLSVFADTHHEGVQSGTWTPAGNTHLIDDDCWIPPRSTLNIEAGCLVEFQGHYCIIDSGTFNAIGTTESPIIFTSHPDSQFAGYWKALIADGASGSPATMTLTNCEIKYGGESMSGWLDEDGVIQGVQFSAIEIYSCYIHNNLGSGVGTAHAGHNQVRMYDSHIDSCEAGAKLLTVDQLSTEVKRNQITNCGVGMRLYTANGAPIVNNIVYASTDTAVAVVGISDNFKNNVIDSARNVGMYLYTDISNSIIENNIIVNSNGYGIAQESGSGDVKYCDVWNNNGGNYHNLSAGTGSISSDPKFVGVVGSGPYDYHLRWNSPCIGTGDDELSNSNPAISCSMP
jgi:hypothetical protein